MLKLNDATLLRQQCYLDGAWLSADQAETIVGRNPASGETLGSVPKMGAAETRRAIVTLQANGAGDVRSAAEDLARLLGRFCGGAIRIGVASAAQPRLEV